MNEQFLCPRPAVGIGTKLMITGALLIASSSALRGTVYVQTQTSGTGATICVSALPSCALSEGGAIPTVASIEQAGSQRFSFDEDEMAPPPPVIAEAVRIVQEAAGLLSDEMPHGRVSTFWGEVNVTWRSGENIVRLACFPNRENLVQVGSLSSPLGSYRSEFATAELLASRLEELNRESA
jgi:hypothetical protein